MTGPRIDELDRALAEIRGQQAPNDIDAALAEIRGTGKRDFHEEYRKGLLGPRMARENANERDQLENPYSAAIGEVAKHGANIAQGIPGMEALQAGIGSLVSGNSYKQSLNDLRGETETINPGVRFVEKLAGGLPLGALIPGGPVKTLGQAVKSGVKAGAALGGADAALRADPMSLGDRAIGTATGATIGGVLGGAVGGVAKGVDKARQLNTLRKRANAQPTSGAALQERADAMGAADAVNYKNAEIEGQIAQHFPTPEKVTAALAEPDIAPYAQVIRESRTYRGADDHTVLREAFKLMSERQGKLANIADAGDFKAGTSLAKSDVGLAKRQLLEAADEANPAFRPAVESHREGASDIGTFQQSLKDSERLMSGRKPAPDKVLKQSPEAIARRTAKLDPEQSRTALDAYLSTAKDAFPAIGRVSSWDAAAPIAGAFIGGGPGAAAGVGAQLGGKLLNKAVVGAGRLNRLSPFIDQLDRQAGHTPYQNLEVEKILKLLGIVNAPLANPSP